MYAMDDSETLRCGHCFQIADSDDCLYVLDVRQQHQHLRAVPHHPNSHFLSRRPPQHGQGYLPIYTVFEPYEGMLPSLAKYKIMYAGINLILLGIVLYKMSAMGMLPVLAADYVDLVPTFDVQLFQFRPLE